jgi:hypothetical protein
MRRLIFSGYASAQSVTGLVVSFWLCRGVRLSLALRHFFRKKLFLCASLPLFLVSE